jgi:hypothetical protein
MSIPELSLSATVSEMLGAIAASESLESFEARALDPTERRALATELASPEWRAFIIELARAWRMHDHAVVRGLPVLGDGTTTLLLALALDAEFKPYRTEKIVKHFKMSPWTTDLSQTLREGHFHTDLSTADKPPSATLIHCRVPDPTPGYGAVRVVRLRDLLAELRRRGADETLGFLLTASVEMIDEHAQGSWSGIMAGESAIRFHPETLRAAERRGARFTDALEHQLDTIHDAALAASEPIELGKGDALFVSNVRALHYRGACTARYLEFPLRFEAREIHVLHLRDEPTWPE